MGLLLPYPALPLDELALLLRNEAILFAALGFVGLLPLLQDFFLRALAQNLAT